MAISPVTDVSQVPLQALGVGAEVEVLRDTQWQRGKITQLEPMLASVNGKFLPLLSEEYGTEWRCSLRKGLRVWVWWGGDLRWYEAKIVSVHPDHIIVGYADGSDSYLKHSKAHLQAQCTRLKRLAKAWCLQPPVPPTIVLYHMLLA